MSNNAVVDQLAALLEAGTDAGAFSLADPKLTAIMMFNALHGAADAAVGGRHTPGQATPDSPRL